MKKKNKILSSIEVLIHALFGLGVTYKGFGIYSKKVASSLDSTDENSVGFDDINLLFNKTVHTNNFVIFHVKKNDNNALLAEKIEFCQKNNISVGLVLDTDASNLATIYEDVDFLQAIVKQYRIDLPVYCNINNIMDSKSLNSAQRAEIMKAFIDKMSRSDIYFGFYGTDSNLCDCKNYVLDTSMYDCYVVQESDIIKYDGTCNIKKNLDGGLSASIDLAEIINSKNLNNSQELVYSANYRVQPGDTYHSLSLKFGLSEEDLRVYNGNPKEELSVNQIIAIPNLYKSYNVATREFKYNYAVARGIDISDYQNNINWDKVAETSDFVIVEVARDPGNYEKNNGEFIEESIEQVKNVVEKDIELGLYFCIYKDMKISEYESRLNEYLTKFEEGLKVNNVILKKENIPVFLDFEVFYEYNDYYGLMSSFERICMEHGFSKIGIYGNGNTLSNISKSLKRNGEHIELKDTSWFVWKAGGLQYSSNENNDPGVKIEELIEPKSESNSQYTPVVLQVTNVCKDTGASNDTGNCDVNYCYSSDLFSEKFTKDIKEEDGVNDQITSYIVVDLEQYKGISLNNITNATVNVLIALECVVVAAKVIGNRMILKIKRNLSLSKDNAKKRIK